MCPVEINIQENLTTRDDDQNALMDRFLYEYVKEDNIVTFKSCVQKHSPDKLVTPSGNSLLHVAVSYESDNIAAYLAEEFPSLITSRNDQEDTILHVAAREGRLSNTVKTLVGSNPCLVKLKNRKGNIPLHDAVIRGKKDAVAWLVCKDPGAVYYNNKTTNKSPLYLAVERGHKNGILDDLLNIEASSGTLREGKSPVHAAIEQRNKDILEKIGKAKPELLRFKDKELGNSLHYASSMGYLEGVRFLLQKFPDGANERDQEGNYPIHLACKNDSVDLVKEFMKVFPYPKEFLNAKGQNILHVAAESGQGKVVRHILKQDQKLIEPLLNGIDEDGNTPLHLATQSGQSNAAFALVRDTHVERSIVNNENKTPYDIAEDQSKIAVDQYEKTDEMLAEERKQFASKNNTPADGTQDKAVDPKKQDKKKPSKDYKLLDYYGAMTTLSILYFKARPKKSLQEHFSSSQGKPPRKEETKSRIQNLLVVAVLVAGVTFSGAIQLPQLKNISNSNEHHHGFNITSTVFHNNTAFESPTGSSLLDGYLCLDVWALNTSVVAAIILLWTNLNDVKFAPFVVWFSSLMVGGAIYMMCLAFFFAVSIALGGSDYGVLAIIIIVVGVVFFLAQTLLYIQWILPPSVNQILEGMLSYYVYFLSFLFLFYSWRWLPDKLSELKRGRTSNESSSG
ncbi:protein ACCELERATED CELL DEATH 6 [Populus alba]|uniref:Ankyrin repeat-containing protein n=2 Tax=Populus TaxID=3689 RepID=A0A4U5P4N3_POPAL|nr:protein ACCELERATED CELL DEATH 6-like [Populus alba]KAJ6952715.1 protein ACCELERATED CELL DEATH 6-like [Populus alba x Populus x berolinensis]TKR90621.1 ankyrin repeat-containing protein [Populus alba]